ncbi:hypothetical protein IWW50_000074 [Coemansia erecta]|nr:hypothetical protein GGF43_000638 [Coemansia sp. RSA 2618]KAJ2830758.1 hypothetical protein IWW50_000074 [Coemansia erecta]
MTSYSFGTASTALMGSALDTAKGSSGASYDSAHMYRRGAHAGSPSHYQQAPAQTGSHATAGDTKALDAQGNSVLADYFLKQQAMTLGERAGAQREQPADISSMVAAVAAATTSGSSSMQATMQACGASSMNAYGYDAARNDAGSPSPGAGAALVDPLPGFLSSLPMDSKYAMVAGMQGDAQGARRATPSGGLLAAAAAAAASVVEADSGALEGQPLAYARPAYAAASQANESAYTVDGFSFAHNTSSTAALAPSLSEQSAAAPGANAAPDLTAYSISAFSRPLSQNNSTAVLLGGESGAYAGNPGASGLVGSLSSVSQMQGVLSPHASQPPQASQQQYYTQQQQQRSYSDYSAYYRSPSTTLGMNTATSTSAAGASPMSGTGGATQLSAAAAAAAAAMNPAYYTPAAYQQYMRTTGGAAPYSYYYTNASRYLPYGAYPPVRHFVSPARPFKCETCEQSFSRNHDLKRHVKIHSGIKPHKCSKCGKSFGRSDALKRHSMVKRCRSSTTSSVQPPRHAHGASGANGGSRLAPVNALYGQVSAPSGSAVSNMMSTRTNSI